MSSYSTLQTCLLSSRSPSTLFWDCVRFGICPRAIFGQLAWPRNLRLSNVAGFVILGFILGGLIVGLLAGSTETRLLGVSGSQNEVAIVIGAASATNSQFYSPSILSVKVGTSVTWINQDTAVHTVTSTSGAFDSGNMNSGAVYKLTFTQPGNYSYYCKYHLWMKGTIVVTTT